MMNEMIPTNEILTIYLQYLENNTKITKIYNRIHACCYVSMKVSFLESACVPSLKGTTSAY